MFYTTESVSCDVKAHSVVGRINSFNMRSVSMLKIVAALLCIVAIFFVSCGNGSVDNDNAITVKIKDTDAIVFSSKEPLADKSSFKIGDIYIVENNTDKSAEIAVFYNESTANPSVLRNKGAATEDKNGVFTLQLPPETSAEFRIESKDDALKTGSIMGRALQNGDMVYYYAADESVFTKALESGADVVAVTENIAIEGDLVIGKPIQIVLFEKLEVSGTVVFEYDGDGLFGIDNESADFVASEFFVEAPECDVSVKKDIEGLEGKISYYVRAKSYNGTKMTESERVVHNEDELIKLADTATYPKLQAGDTLLIAASLSLSQDVLIEQPVAIVANNNISGSGRICLQTEAEGEILVFDCDMERIQIDAPRCKLTWNGNMAPDEESCALFYNVAYYNGKSLSKYGLGGLGKNKLTKLVMHAKDNPELEGDVVWEVDGNCLFATVDFALSESVLQKAKLNAVSDGGKVSFEGAEGLQEVDLTEDGYCVVTDDEGKIRRYLVVTSRKLYELPAVFIDTEEKADIVSKEKYIKATFSLKGGKTGLDDIDKASISIRGRGHSSWLWEKKPYKIKFDKKISLFGLQKAKEWVLLANHSDKSLIRNHLAMKLGRVLDNLAYTPHQYMVDVFLNGEYIGVYTMGEQIEVKSGRVEISENYNDPNTGYLLEVGGSEDGDVLGKDYFHTETIKFIRIKSPDTEKMSDGHFRYISEYFQKTDEAIRNLSNYEEYIDVDSFIDWFIMYEVSYNLDGCFRRSCYITKEKNGKLKMGPIWDFDLAFGNFVKDNKNYDDWASVGAKDEYVGVTWMNYLLEDDKFRHRLRERWDSIKENLGKTAKVTIAAAAEKLENSQRENFKVWDILGKRAGYESNATIKYDSFEEQIEYLSEFIKRRIDWIDKNI